MTLHRIVQYAWVVPSLEDAARAWHATTGIGPFLVNRDIAVQDQQYRGRACTTRFSTAVAQHGDTQIELVMQLDDGPSVYRDSVAPGATRFHHTALLSNDFDADRLAYCARGHVMAAEGSFGPMRYAYVDTVAALGHMTEIIENTPTIQLFFAAIRKAADRWDRNPDTLLRELG